MLFDHVNQFANQMQANNQLFVVVEEEEEER